jgi:hypothetical protein
MLRGSSKLRNILKRQSQGSHAMTFRLFRRFRIVPRLRVNLSKGGLPRSAGGACGTPSGGEGSG